VDFVRPARPVSTVPAAASDLARPLLTGPAVCCAVVTTSRTALHADTGNDAVPVLSVFSPGGPMLPGACLLAHPLPHVSAIDHLRVGGGKIRIDRFVVSIRRWWPQLSVSVPKQLSGLRAGSAALSVALDRSGRMLAEPVAESVDHLISAVTGRDGAATRRAVHAMVGLGPGLTPAADDVLVGALLAWYHLGRAGWPAATAVAGSVSAAVLEDRHRTTAVSAALLHHAIRGSSVREAVLVLDALRTPGGVAVAVDSLSRVGHDTGLSIAHGIKIAVGAVLGAFSPERVAP
jgi:hypothetical protein